VLGLHPAGPPFGGVELGQELLGSIEARDDAFDLLLENWIPHTNPVQHGAVRIDVKITGLSGIYSGPRHVIAYDDGEVRQEFSLCFHAKPVGGTLRPSSESRQARWISPDSLPDLKIHPSMRLRVTHALTHDQQPYLG
jgi:hypothetical protein